VSARFVVGDTRDVVASLPDGSVDLVMTSPPFLALRSYLPPDHPWKDREIGSEATPADFLDTLLSLTEEWGRVLAPHGSICVELGDTYSGSGGAGGDYGEGGLREGQGKFDGSALRMKGNGWPLDKSLCGIPSLYANSLAYGRNLLNPEHTVEPWRVRNWVAWVRPNPPVGALGDKVRPATSYLTWATRSRTRWFDLDAVRMPPSANTHARVAKNVGTRDNDTPSGQRDGNWSTLPITNEVNPAGAPPLDWWNIPPGGYTGSHYAVYPEELCRIPIEASCPRRVCRSCGEPSRRVVDSGEVLGRGRSSRSYQKQVAIGEANTNGRFRPPDNADRTTTGWTTCGCLGTDGLRLDGYHDGPGWRPGIVLDPFGGSGTTGVVAVGRGRDAILVDLDERNADLAYQRLGMFLEVEHHQRAVS
jgi:DNA modification methylase